MTTGNDRGLRDGVSRPIFASWPEMTLPVGGSRVCACTTGSWCFLPFFRVFFFFYLFFNFFSIFLFHFFVIAYLTSNKTNFFAMSSHPRGMCLRARSCLSCYVLHIIEWGKQCNDVRTRKILLLVLERCYMSKYDIVSSWNSRKPFKRVVFQ